MIDEQPSSIQRELQERNQYYIYIYEQYEHQSRAGARSVRMSRLAPRAAVRGLRFGSTPGARCPPAIVLRRRLCQRRRARRVELEAAE